MLYNVLDIVYKRTKLRTDRGEMVYEVEWKKIGEANSFKQAKEKYGGNPVLEIKTQF
jgi:hypothetical protein